MFPERSGSVPNKSTGNYRNGMPSIMNVTCNSLQLVSGPLLVPLEDLLQVRQPEYDVISVNEQMRLHFQLET